MRPEPIQTIASMRERVAAQRKLGRSIGLVPTMGALHAGHGALIDRAREGAGYVTVSIFVNPIQFDRRDDFTAYARDLERDLAFCEEHGVDAVFAPPAEEMYPGPPGTFVEVPELQAHLCGPFRPGHFRGVATVVAKLLHIVAPDKAWFGEKDAQQLAIIKRMVLDLNMPVEIVSVATVREADGLALSSRNQRLSAEERRIAPALFRALTAGQRNVLAGCGSAAEVRNEVLRELQSEPQLRPEYVEVVDPASMSPVEQISGPVRIAAAVWLGATRLIDNVYCDPGGSRPA